MEHTSGRIKYGASKTLSTWLVQKASQQWMIRLEPFQEMAPEHRSIIPFYRLNLKYLVTTRKPSQDWGRASLLVCLIEWDLCPVGSESGSEQEIRFRKIAVQLSCSYFKKGKSIQLRCWIKLISKRIILFFYFRQPTRCLCCWSAVTSRHSEHFSSAG